MPTAGRLTAGIVMALVGGYVAYIAGPLFSEGKQPSFWFPLCIATGLWAGWVVVGKRAGRGYRAAIGNGLTGGAALAFWVVFIVSFEEMIRKSMRRAYDGPMEAITDVFEIALEVVRQIGTLDVLVALAVGAILAGLIAEFYSKRFS